MQRKAQHDARSAAMQLMQVQSMLAPWTYRQDEDGGVLPFPLDHGPLSYLQHVLQLAETPQLSAKMLDDALILLTYGASYLQDHDDATRSHARLDERRMQRQEARQQWRRKAARVQATWRSQRFHTARLPVLELRTSEYLLPDVQARIRAKKSAGGLERQDTLENLTNVPVETNEKELEAQVVKYAADLQLRVETRRREEEEQQRKELRELRIQEDRKKRQLLQKKKKHEHACRRWHFFATRLLRKYREDNDDGTDSRVGMRRSTILPDDKPLVVLHNGKAAVLSKTGEVMTSRAPKSKPHRGFVRRFVVKAIARGMSRVLCAYGMKTSDADTVRTPVLQDVGEESTGGQASVTTASTKRVIRLGLLLCDLHFGVKYRGLYERFFERIAEERGLRIEWLFFNGLKSDFPTRAQQRLMDGLLVAGGPNTGVNPNPTSNEESEEIAMKKNRHFGRWRRRLLGLLRYLHDQKQTILGGLGLGHVILAEALGARVAMKEWEDGWNVLERNMFEELGSGAYHSTASSSHPNPSSRLGVRFLHGEYVQSMGTMTKGIKSWRSPDGGFVTCFRDKLTLSMDGSPECGSFVFETLSEFYEREKQTRIHRQSNDLATTPLSDGSDDGEDDSRVVLEGVLNLEEKKKLLGVTDGSLSIARLFFDHFHRRIIIATSTDPASGMAIAGTVCSGDINGVDESIRQMTKYPGIASVFMNVSTSGDGHLVVTNPTMHAVLVEEDRKSKDNHKRHSGQSLMLSTRKNASQGLTLHELRDYGKGSDTMAAKGNAGSTTTLPRTRSIRLPSIKTESSASSLLDSIAPNEDVAEVTARRRTTAISAMQAYASGTSVLTLSEALTLVHTDSLEQQRIADPVQSKLLAESVSGKRVFIRILDEECKQSHDLIPMSRPEFRTLWLRLVSAVRISDLVDDQVVIVSRQSKLLDYFRRKRPTWTFVKDCRRTDMPHRKRLKKVAQFARCADIVLFDQEFLLSNSAKENDAVFRKARALGLQIYVARREETPIVKLEGGNSERFVARKSIVRRTHSRGGAMTRKISKNQGTERDMQIVEFMLLHFSGVHGVITSVPEVGSEALEKIRTKSEAMQEVELMFRSWQAKDNGKVITYKRGSHQNNGSNTYDEGDPDSENEEDYIGVDNYDSDDSIPEKEVVTEMTRQWAEHTSHLNGLLAGGTPAFIPLRPLQPKTGDQVLGGRRQSTMQNIGALAPEGRNRLRSIGSFRSGLQRSATDSSRPLTEGASQQHLDDRQSIRNAESTVVMGLSVGGVAPLKSMSTRRVIISPR